jgi:DNA-binding transcriptional LysR family regulator
MPIAYVTAFVAVVEAGSFTRAARVVGVDKTLLSRRVKGLEEAIQTRLLQRTTRRVSVTNEGRALYERIAPHLTGLLRAIPQVRVEAPEGLVRAASLPVLAEDLWVPVIAALAQSHPKLRVELRASENLVNLVEGGFDLAVRSGNLPSSSLVARRIATWRYVLCASPKWLRDHARIKRPSDLEGCWLMYIGVPNADRWRFRRGKVTEQIRVKPVLTSDNSHVLVAAARAGVGVAALAPSVVSRDLREGTLVRVLPDWVVDHSHGIFAVMPHRSHVPLRVQTVLNLLVDRARAMESQWRELAD